MNLFDIFTAHPREHNITYMQPMMFSLNLGVSFFVASIQAVIHAVFPFIFESSSSKTLLYCENIIKNKKIKRKRLYCNYYVFQIILLLSL